jgi:hypothetical protein
MERQSILEPPGLMLHPSGTQWAPTLHSWGPLDLYDDFIKVPLQSYPLSLAPD